MQPELEVCLSLSGLPPFPLIVLVKATSLRLVTQGFQKPAQEPVAHLQHPLHQLLHAALLWNPPIDHRRHQRQLQLSAQGGEAAPDLTSPLWVFTQKVECLFVEGSQTNLWI